MEDLRQLAKTTSNDKMKTKIAELIQIWAHAFRNDPSCRAVQDTLQIMKNEGFKFPALKEADAMFSASTAPQWVDGDCCSRCRVAFGVVQRKHHCRCCGQVFCDKCSSKNSQIPKFGIEKEVRVCDECFEQLNTTKPMLPRPSIDHGVANLKVVPAKASAPVGKSEQELREEEELAMAIALSKSEAEARENRLKSHSYSSSYSTKSTGNSTCTPSSNVSSLGTLASKVIEDVDDPELSKYLNREYWEQKKQRPRNSSPAPSAPAPSNMSAVASTGMPLPPSCSVLPSKGTSQEEEEREKELQEFSTNLKSSLEMFVNRMNSNKLRGRPIANDSSVQSLFLTITNMHSHLIKNIQDEEDTRVNLEALQDKLNEIKDARAALDALREEHREKKRREAEELEALRQQQMANKLEIMRKKKQEYLQYQRQLALQQIQDQERELQFRKQQQKYGVVHPPQVATSVAGQPWPPHSAAMPPPAQYAVPVPPAGPYGLMSQGHSRVGHFIQPPLEQQPPASIYNPAMYQPVSMSHPATVAPANPPSAVAQAVVNAVPVPQPPPPPPPASHASQPVYTSQSEQQATATTVTTSTEVPEAPLISFD